MNITSRKVLVRIVDCKLTADEWDAHTTGSVVWKNHMASLLNLRVKKLAERYDANEFHYQLARFALELGFGDQRVITKVTEKVYKCRLNFNQKAAA